MTSAFQELTSGAWPRDPAVPPGRPSGLVEPHFPPDPNTRPSPISPEEAAARRKKFQDLILKQVILALTGVSVGDPFTQLKNWADNLPEAIRDSVVGDFVELFTGEEDGDLEDLGTWALGLRTDIDNFFANLSQIIRNLVSGNGEVAHQQFVSMLFSLLRPEWLPLVPLTSIGNTETELLLNATFQDAISIVGGPGVEWDATIGRTSLGSAKLTADGAQKSLSSNPIPVSPGQKIHMKSYARWASLVFTGSPIKLQAWAFLDDVPSAVDPITDIDSITPGGSSGGFPNGPDTSPPSTGLLSGDYTVPSSGVNKVRLRLTLTGDASSGWVNYDDSSYKKFQTLEMAFTDGLNAFKNEANQIRDVLAGLVVTPINSYVQDIKDWWAEQVAKTQQLTLGGNLNLGNVLDTVGDNAQSFLDRLKAAFSGGAPANVTGAEVAAAAAQAQLLAQNFTITQAAGGYRNPIHVCRYPIGDVSYPESMNYLMSIVGVTDAQSAGTAHTHNLGVSGDLYAGAQLWGIVQNASRACAIAISSSTVMDTMAAAFNRDSGTALNNVFLELYRINSDGSSTQIQSTDVSASITTSTTTIEVPLTAGVIVQAGEQYLLKVRNSSTVSTGLYVKALTNSSAQSDTSWYVTTSVLSLKTSYTSAEMTTAYSNSPVVPWGMLAAKSLPGTPRSYSDDANRAEIGGSWFPKSNTGANFITIANGRFAFQGTTDGDQNSIYILPTIGDASRVDGVLYGTLGAVTTPRCGLMMHCNRDLSQIVYLGVNNNSARIYSGPWGSLTQRATVSTAFNDVPWSLYYEPGVGSYGRYTALKDDASVGMTWSPGASDVVHGDNYRYGGLRISRATLFNAGSIDNWALRDWAP